MSEQQKQQPKKASKTQDVLKKATASKAGSPAEKVEQRPSGNKVIRR